MDTKFLKWLTVVLFIPVLMLVSCNGGDLYNRTVGIPESGWYKNEGVRFDVFIGDTLTDYDFYISLRNNNDYRYSNLYIFLNTIMPNGNKTRDTLEIILADDMGKWLGKGWGSVKENDVLLRKNLRFPRKGDYRFLIQQAMRTDTLKGITDVGLRVAKAQD